MRATRAHSLHPVDVTGSEAEGVSGAEEPLGPAPGKHALLEHRAGCHRDGAARTPVVVPGARHPGRPGHQPDLDTRVLREPGAGVGTGVRREQLEVGFAAYRRARRSSSASVTVGASMGTAEVGVIVSILEVVWPEAGSSVRSDAATTPGHELSRGGCRIGHLPARSGPRSDMGPGEQQLAGMDNYFSPRPTLWDHPRSGYGPRSVGCRHD